MIKHIWKYLTSKKYRFWVNESLSMVKEKVIYRKDCVQRLLDHDPFPSIEDLALEDYCARGNCPIAVYHKHKTLGEPPKAAPKEPKE